MADDLENYRAAIVTYDNYIDVLKTPSSLAANILIRPNDDSNEQAAWLLAYETLDKDGNVESQGFNNTNSLYIRILQTAAMQSYLYGQYLNFQQESNAVAARSRVSHPNVIINQHNRIVFRINETFANVFDTLSGIDVDGIKTELDLTFDQVSNVERNDSKGVTVNQVKLSWLAAHDLNFYEMIKTNKFWFPMTDVLLQQLSNFGGKGGSIDIIQKRIAEIAFAAINTYLSLKVGNLTTNIQSVINIQIVEIPALLNIPNNADISFNISYTIVESDAVMLYYSTLASKVFMNKLKSSGHSLQHVMPSIHTDKYLYNTQMCTIGKPEKLEPHKQFSNIIQFLNTVAPCKTVFMSPAWYKPVNPTTDGYVPVKYNGYLTNFPVQYNMTTSVGSVRFDFHTATLQKYLPLLVSPTGECLSEVNISNGAAIRLFAITAGGVLRDHFDSILNNLTLIHSLTFSQHVQSMLLVLAGQASAVRVDVVNDYVGLINLLKIGIVTMMYVCKTYRDIMQLLHVSDKDGKFNRITEKITIDECKQTENKIEVPNQLMFEGIFDQQISDKIDFEVGALIIGLLNDFKPPKFGVQSYYERQTFDLPIYTAWQHQIIVKCIKRFYSLDSIIVTLRELELFTFITMTLSSNSTLTDISLFTYPELKYTKDIEFGLFKLSIDNSKQKGNMWTVLASNCDKSVKNPTAINYSYINHIIYTNQLVWDKLIKQNLIPIEELSKFPPACTTSVHSNLTYNASSGAVNNKNIINLITHASNGSLSQEQVMRLIRIFSQGIDALLAKSYIYEVFKTYMMHGDTIMTLYYTYTGYFKNKSGGRVDIPNVIDIRAPQNIFIDNILSEIGSCWLNYINANPDDDAALLTYALIINSNLPYAGGYRNGADTFVGEMGNDFAGTFINESLNDSLVNLLCSQYRLIESMRDRKQLFEYDTVDDVLYTASFFIRTVSKSLGDLQIQRFVKWNKFLNIENDAHEEPTSQLPMTTPFYLNMPANFQMAFKRLQEYNVEIPCLENAYSLYMSELKIKKVLNNQTLKVMQLDMIKGLPTTAYEKWGTCGLQVLCASNYAIMHALHAKVSNWIYSAYNYGDLPKTKKLNLYKYCKYLLEQINTNDAEIKKTLSGPKILFLCNGIITHHVFNEKGRIDVLSTQTIKYSTDTKFIDYASTEEEFSLRESALQKTKSKIFFTENINAHIPSSETQMRVEGSPYIANIASSFAELRRLFENKNLTSPSVSQDLLNTSRKLYDAITSGGSPSSNWSELLNNKLSILGNTMPMTSNSLNAVNGVKGMYSTPSDAKLQAMLAACLTQISSQYSFTLNQINTFIKQLIPQNSDNIIVKVLDHIDAYMKSGASMDQVSEYIGSVAASLKITSHSQRAIQIVCHRVTNPFATEELRKIIVSNINRIIGHNGEEIVTDQLVARLVMSIFEAFHIQNNLNIEGLIQKIFAYYHNTLINDVETIKFLRQDLDRVLGTFGQTNVESHNKQMERISKMKKNYLPPGVDMAGSQGTGNLGSNVSPLKPLYEILKDYERNNINFSSETSSKLVQSVEILKNAQLALRKHEMALHGKSLHSNTL